MHINYSHPVAIFSAFELPEFDQGLMISKSVVTTFYHDLNERKTGLKYSVFQGVQGISGPFSCKILEKREFQKSRKKFLVDETPEAQCLYQLCINNILQAKLCIVAFITFLENWS